MKKLLVLVTVVAMCFLVTSCDNKKETAMLGDCELTSANAKFGLKYDGVTILPAVYDVITLDDNAGVYLALSEGMTNVIDAKSHSQLFTDIVEEIIPMQNGFFYVKAAKNRRYLYKGSSTWGPCEEIVLKDNFTFMETDGKWGVAMVSPRVGLAPRKYDKVYIVKNQSTFAVLVYDGKTWKMFDSDGVTEGAAYDLSSNELLRELKKVNVPDSPVGIIDVGWKL